MRSAIALVILSASFCLAPMSTSLSGIDIRPVLTKGADADQMGAWIENGRKALLKKEFDHAYDLLMRAHIESPETGTLRADLGNALLGLAQYKDALAHFRAAPRTPESFAGAVLCKAALGISEDIEVELNDALEINLSDTRLWLALGRFYDGQDRSIEARSTFVQALKFGADHAVIVNSLGMSLLRSGRHEAALEKFQQANAIEPDVAVFDNNRRLTLALQGDFSGAVSGISENRAARIYNDAGFIAAGAGKMDVARALYNKALQISPVYFAPAQANLDALKTAS